MEKKKNTIAQKTQSSYYVEGYVTNNPRKYVQGKQRSRISRYTSSVVTKISRFAKTRKIPHMSGFYGNFLQLYTRTISSFKIETVQLTTHSCERSFESCKRGHFGGTTTYVCDFFFKREKRNIQNTLYCEENMVKGAHNNRNIRIN